MSINFNCKILPSEQPIFTASNRAFRYGDGLFETIRVFDGKIPFFQRHFQRLIVGCRLLNLDVSGHFTQDFFENEISKLLVGGANYRVRLTVWRSGGGLYTPETNLPDFLIEAKELPSSVFELNNLCLIFTFYLHI